MPYEGYSGYSEESVARKRALADALYKRSLDSRGQPIQHFTQGLAKLADAYFAREAMDDADAASTAFQDSRKAIGDKMLAQAFPDGAGPTEDGPAFDLTPAANIARQNPSPYAGQVQQMAELTGDPLKAMEYGRGLEDRQSKLDDIALQRKLLAEKLGAPIEVSKGASLYDQKTGKAIYTAPDNSPEGARKLHSAIIGKDGHPNMLFSDGSEKRLDWQATDTIKSLDVGGVPYLYSGRGDGAPTPVSTAADVGANVGTVETAKVLGKSQGEAIRNLPEITASADRAIASIDELLNSKGFDAAYGIGRLNPLNMIPGSDAKNTEAIRGKLDGQFFVNAITAMQVSLAPVSDADAIRLVSSVSQLTNADISPAEARRVAGELKAYFNLAKQKAMSATGRGPVDNGGVKKLAQISSDEEFARLPSGAMFIGPDGKTRQKP